MKDAAETFGSLYRSHAPAVHRRALELLGDRAEAAEVVQDVFASLWEHPDQFGGRSALTTFLYGAATHACLNRLRNARTRDRLLAQHVHREDAPAGAPARTEHLVALRELLVLLPDELARAAVYYYLDEMTYDEIAQTMRCSRRHVANLLKKLLEWHRDPETRS